MSEAITKVGEWQLVEHEDAALINNQTGQGTSSDRTQGTFIGYQNSLSIYELEQLYRSALPRKVNDMIVDEATREGAKIEFGGEDADAEVSDSIFRSLDILSDGFGQKPVTNAQVADRTIWDFVGDAQKLGRLYGGSLVVLYINDGLRPDQPVDLRRIRSIDGMDILDRYQAYPDYTRGNVLHPEYYGLSVSGFDVGFDKPRLGSRIHKSRVLRFTGAQIPAYRLGLQYYGWDQPIMDLCWGEYRDWASSIGAVAEKLTNFDVFYHAVSDFAKKSTSPNGRAELQAIMKGNSARRSVYGGYMYDKDKESIGFINSNLAQVPELVKLLQTTFTAASEVPFSKFWGQAEGGQVRAGRSEERDFAQAADRYRTRHWTAKFNRLITYLMAAKNGPTNGEILPNWKLKFNNLFQLTEEEEAALYLQTAQADKLYVDMGVLDPVEDIRPSRFASTTFGLSIALNDDADPEPTDSPSDSKATTDRLDTAYEGIDMKPTKAMRDAAKRGLELFRQGYGGDGLVDGTTRWARRIAAGQPLTPDKWRKMNAWHARHESDRKDGWDNPPTHGYVAFLLWAGLPGQSRSAKIAKMLDTADERSDAAHAEYVRYPLIKMHGLTIGLSHKPGDLRGNNLVHDAYGHIRGHKEPRDGMALDVFLGDDLTSPKIFRGNQLTSDGAIEQHKIFMGYPNMKSARDAFLRNRPQKLVGGMEEITIDDLKAYQSGAQVAATDAMGVSGIARSLETFAEVDMDKLDAQPPKRIQASGQTMSESELDALASVNESDLTEVAKAFQKVAPDKFKDILLAEGDNDAAS